MNRAGWHLGLILSALVLASCTPKEDDTLEPEGKSSASVVLFSAEPEAVKAGESVSLSWVAANALELVLSANGEAIGDPIPPGDSRLAQGSVTFTPTVTTVFRLEVKGEDGEVAFREAEVRVIDLMVAAIDDFRAEPAEIPEGLSSTLLWKTTDAASIRIEDAEGNPVELLGADPAEGSVVVTPSVTTEYTLFAEAEDGSSEASVTVTVNPAPTLAVIAEPPLIEYGDTAILRWTTEDATSVTVKVEDEILFTTEEELNGSFEVSPEVTTTYTVEALGAGGLTAAHQMIAVQPQVDTFFSDTLGKIEVGMLVDLIWTTSGATRLILENQDGFSLVITGDEVASGTRKAPVGRNGVFVLKAQNGDLEAESTFVFDLVNRPLILDLRVVSGPQTAGPDTPAEVTVRWDVTLARSLSLVAIPGGEVSLAGKSVDSDEVRVTIYGPTSFQLTAENPAGSVNQQVEAEVVDVPRIASFQALPSRVGQGESTSLSWDVSAADRVVLERDGLPVEAVGPQDFSSSITEQLAADTHYRLRAFNSLDHEVTQELTVGVGLPAILNFTADREWSPVEGTIVLSWRAEGGTSLTLTGPGGTTHFSTQDLELIGEHSLSVQAPSEVGPADYVLTLTNAAGPTSGTATVEITDGPVIENFAVTPDRISSDDSIQVSWEVSTDAYGVPPVLSLVDGLGNNYDLSAANPLSGSAGFRLSAPGYYLFTLVARTGDERFSTAEAIVQVLARPELVAAQATPEFASNEGEPIILVWETVDATSLTLFAIGDDGEVQGDAFYTTTRDVAAGTTTFAPTIAAPHVRFVLENEIGTKVESDLRVGVGPASILSFQAQPEEVFRGETVKLSWETARATSVEIRVPDYIETDEEYIDLSQRSTANLLTFNTNRTTSTVLNFPGGFAFPFDGAPRRGIRVSNTGFISFDVNQAGGYDFNVVLPSASRPYLHMTPFTGDMDRAAQSGEVWWELFDAGGDAPFLILQYKNMSFRNETTAKLNYQIVLRHDGTFDFRYGSMSNPPNQDMADGSTAVIGYQNARGTEGVMVSRNTPYPGGLSNRTFHFPVIHRPIEITATTEPFLDISGTPGATEWTSRTASPQFFSYVLVESFPDGFVFPFGGEEYSGLWIMRDGYVSFDLYDDQGNLRTTMSTRNTNLAMGAGSDVIGGSKEVHLAPFWNYLQNNYGDTQGTVWTALREDGRGRFFVVQWKDFSSQDTAIHQNSNLNFQILLREDGSFEYRYGTMDGGSNPRNADGTLSTIGFQERNGVRGTTISFNKPVLGGLTGKGWRIVPEPAFPLSGEVELRPMGESTYTLVARNDHSYQEVSRRVSGYAPASIELSTSPEEPRPGQPFSIDWHSAGLTDLTIEDEEGNVVYREQGTTFDLRHGSFLIAAGLEMGIHRFTVRGLGNLGSSVVEVMDISVFPPFSIDEFSALATTLRLGEKTLLSWRTTDVAGLTLTSDQDGPIELTGLNLANDSLEITPTQTTTYTLTATSEGRTRSKTVVVEVRTISIEDFEISGLEGGVNVIRGAPVTIAWETQGEGGVFWSNETRNSGRPDEYFMYDVSSDAPYEDIEGTSGATQVSGLTSNTSAATVALPFFFGLYDDEPRAEMRVMAHGLVSFRTGDSGSATSNTRFPDPAQAAPNNYTGHLNPRMGIFWDNLNPDGTGKVLTKYIHNPTGPDSFIVQWKGMKFHHSTAASRDGNLNFQLVLHEDQTFEFRYGKMSGTKDDGVPATEEMALRALGSTASIGFRSEGKLEDPSRDFLGQQVSYRTPAHNGGLSNRSFRFTRSTNPFPATATVNLAPLYSTDYKMCASSSTWSECETFRVVVPQPGHLMITELQVDPLGGNPVQWFEVRNLTLDPIDLEGMTLVVGSHSVPIATGKPLVLAPKAYGVFSAETSPSFDSLFVYGTEIDLKTEASIEIRSGDAVMARATWEPTWFAVRAASLSLDPSMQRLGTVSVPSLSSWCESTSMYDDANAGTPGVHGESCLSYFYDVDYLSDKPFVDISEIGVVHPEMNNRWSLEPVPAGSNFAFPFFDQFVQVDEMWSGNFGVIALGPYANSGTTIVAAQDLLQQTPAQANKRATEHGLIAGFWLASAARADLTTKYYSARVMIDGYEVFIAQWNRYSAFLNQYADPDLRGHATHQIQLWENGDIVIAYGDLVGVFFNGSESSVGLAAPDGTPALQYIFKQPILTSHQSILYKKK